MLLILPGVIGGLFAFGIVGLFIGPVVLAVTWALIKAWIEEPAPVLYAEDIAEVRSEPDGLSSGDS
jgi:predicted PurR-regulated permease PerM